MEFYDASSVSNLGTFVPANPMLVFANPPDDAPPNLAAANVLTIYPGDTIPVSGDWGSQAGIPVDTLYFAPGVYDLGQVPSSVNTGIYVVYSNQSIYLAGGAYVKGSL